MTRELCICALTLLFAIMADSALAISWLKSPHRDASEAGVSLNGWEAHREAEGEDWLRQCKLAIVTSRGQRGNREFISKLATASQL